MEIEIIETKKDIPFDLLLQADPSIEMIEEYVRTGKVYLAKYLGEMIGIIVFNQINNTTVEINNISVLEKYQKMGIGKKLINFLINYLRSIAISELIVGTGNSSIDQLIFYQKAGFRIKEVEPDFFRKHYKNKIFENGIECRDMIKLSFFLE